MHMSAAAFPIYSTNTDIAPVEQRMYETDEHAPGPRLFELQVESA